MGSEAVSVGCLRIPRTSCGNRVTMCGDVGAAGAVDEPPVAATLQPAVAVPAAVDDKQFGICWLPEGR